MPMTAMMMTIIHRNGSAGRTILRNRMTAISKMTATGMNAEFWLLLFNHMHLLSAAGKDVRGFSYSARPFW